MTRSRQKSPDPSSHHAEKVSKGRWAVLRPAIELYRRLIENLQWRSHEKLITHVLEERLSQVNRQSQGVALKPEIKGALLTLSGKRKEISPEGGPVLIVDDEKNIRLALSQTLEDLGLKTDSASDGEEALAKLNEKEYGLILLDLNMPGVDGVEVLRQVRESRPDLRVIIMTAYGTREMILEAKQLGASDFIRKPFVPEEIRESVSRVMDRKKLQ
jgi:CheY-like chemotaxis protein